MSLSTRQIENLKRIRMELTADSEAPYGLDGQLEPYLLMLNDVCDVLELDAEQTRAVLGDAGMDFVARWQAEPINIAMGQALAWLSAKTQNGGAP